jgi:hypothetical protein
LIRGSARAAETENPTRTRATSAHADLRLYVVFPFFTLMLSGVHVGFQNEATFAARSQARDGLRMRCAFKPSPAQTDSEENNPSRSLAKNQVDLHSTIFSGCAAAFDN